MAKKIRKSIKKIIYLIMAIIVVVSGTFAAVSIISSPDDEKIYAASENANRVNVNLITMQGKTEIDINVSGVYSLRNLSSGYSDKNGVILRNGNYKLRIQDGNLVLSSDIGDKLIGPNVTFYSHNSGGNNYLTMKNPSYGTCNYKGNMNISISGGKLLFINDIAIEDYLCGVICREMSENQNIESLKVQAVCARSIAYKSIGGNIVDTTANQVYVGYNPNNKKCNSAVEQTAYQVLTYNGSPISAYYASSNGGITEATKNAWVSNLPYYKVQIDPYDTVYKNRIYRLSKTNISSTNKTKMKEKGITGDIISIDSIKPSYDTEPASLPENQRRVQKLTITVTTSNGKQSFELTKQTGVCYTLRCKNANGNETTLPSSKYWIEETDTEFIFHVDGNGHGIGMSQNGVYARVAAGQKYKEILAFYFPGTTLSSLNYTSNVYISASEPHMIDSDIASLKTLSGSVVGSINSNTNLYEKPGMFYNVIGTINANQSVVVTEESNSWYKIVSDDGNISGFVPKKYFTKDDSRIEFNTEVNGMQVGIVNATVIVRNEPNYKEGTQIASLKPEAEVIITGETGAFYEIYYNDNKAYVTKSYINPTNNVVYNVYDATVRAYKANLYTEENEISPIKGYVPEGATVKVFNVSYAFAGCIYKGEISYIKLDKIDIVDGSNGYEKVPRNETEVNVNLKITLVTNAYKYADENSEVIDKLIENDIVKAVVIKDDWYKIVYGDSYAYIKAGNTVMYSDNIQIGYAQVIADKILYSAPDCTTAVVILKANDIVQVIDQGDDMITYMYNGIPCYADRENVIIKTEEVMITKDQNT